MFGVVVIGLVMVVGVFCCLVVVIGGVFWLVLVVGVIVGIDEMLVFWSF